MATLAADIDRAGAPPSADPVLATRGIGKRYGAITVLSDVGVEIRAGEVHAIIGENGAGKSTLMRILSGYVPPSMGTLALDGRDVAFASPREAEAAGIVLVHQEILLAEALTVAENLFLGAELTRGGLVDDRSMDRIARDKLAEFGCRVSPRALVRDVALADRQLIQIARALIADHRVVIFDEPTAVLTSEEVETLLGIILKLKARGIAVLYISHRLDEVERLADRVTVLRDGRQIGTFPGAGLSQMDMARLMVGRELSTLYPPKSARATREPVLTVEGAHVPGFVHDVGFTLHRGEILGFAGMMGAGRTELFEGVLGLRPGGARSMTLEGRAVRFGNVAEAMRAGVGYLTEDRKGKGLLLQEEMAPNLTLAALDRFNPEIVLRRRREASALRSAVAHYDIRARSLSLTAGQLSGGNQQKLLLAKVMMTDPKVVIIDEPTRGVDIANKAQIYGFIQSFVAEGRACIVISSEMQEIIGLCDRALVMREGVVTGELAGAALTESNIALLATSAATARA